MALTQENDAPPGADVEDVRNLTETARFFSVSVPTVREWIVRECPVLEGGSNGVPYKFSLRAVAAWREAELERAEDERRRKRVSDDQLALEIFGEDMMRPEGEGGGVLSAKQIREHAAAQRELVAVELARGRLVRVDDLAAVLTVAMRTFADQVRAIPDELARRHGLAPELVGVLADDLDEALNDLADQVVEATGGGE